MTRRSPSKGNRRQVVDPSTYRTGKGGTTYHGDAATCGCEEITLLPQSRTPVRGTNERDGFLSLEQHPQLFTSPGWLPAYGVMKFQRFRPFTIPVSIFSTSTDDSRKGK